MEAQSYAEAHASWPSSEGDSGSSQSQALSLCPIITTTVVAIRAGAIAKCPVS